MEIPCYLTVSQAAGLFGQETRIARKWLHDAGILFRRPGSRRLLVPLDRLRQAFPDAWERYAEQTLNWDLPGGCEHAVPELLPPGAKVCRDCGAVFAEGRWRHPRNREGHTPAYQK